MKNILKRSINNQICVLETIWFKEIEVCVSWNGIHHLNEITRREKICN